jgi:hypothetical protein
MFFINYKQVYPKAFLVGYLGQKSGVNWNQDWNQKGVSNGRSLTQWQR